MKTILTSLLTIISMFFSGCAADNSPLPADSFTSAVVSATDYIALGESNEKRTVEITDTDTLNALREIIEAQQQCDTVEGDNYLSVCPKLELAYPDGREITISYTWCSEEYGTDPLDGAPTVIQTGECFLIHGDGLTKRYAVKDRDTQEQFCRLISDYVANTEPAEKPNNDILLVVRDTNYAWGKQDYGAVIDRNGDVYSFDIASHTVDESGFLDLMRELIETNEPVKRSVFAESKVNEILEQVEKVNTAAEYTERHAAYDMGQTTLYALRGNKLIVLRSIGDWERELNDSAAKKICEIYDNRNNAEKAQDFFDGFISRLKDLFS
ncbi:MAG: hypothetical protein ACI4KM_07705 [Oscillospiraceae bacterium]